MKILRGCKLTQIIQICIRRCYI